MKRLSVVACVTAALTGAATTAWTAAASAEGSSAVSWGGNGVYELGAGYKSAPGEPSPVSVLGLTNITALSSGYRFSLALLSDGTVRAFGGPNAHGELGDGERGTEVSGEEEGAANETTNGHFVTVQVPGSPPKSLAGVTAIAARGTHALALLESGKVVAWGDDEFGELGKGELNPLKKCEPGYVSPCPGHEEPTMQGSGSSSAVEVPGLENVTVIGAGGFTDFAARRTTTGEEVLAWGDNQNDELGTGIDGSSSEQELCKNEFATKTKTLACSTKPRAVKGLPTSLANGETHVVAIRGGHDFTVILLSDGSVWSFGEDGLDQLGSNAKLSNEPKHRTDEAVQTNVTGASEISAGYAHVLTRRSNGEVWGWGSDGENDLGTTPPTEECPGNPKAKCKKTPEALAGFNAAGRLFASVAAGTGFSLAATTTGALYSVGRNEHGELGRGQPLGWSPKAKSEAEKKEEAAEIVSQEAEDHEVRHAEGPPGVASVEAGNEFAVALLSSGETAPAAQLTVTPQSKALELAWTFNIEPSEEFNLRWFTYVTCEKGGALCEREKVGPEHNLPSTQHTFTFKEVENTRPHRVVIKGGKHSAGRTRYIWGTPLE